MSAQTSLCPKCSTPLPRDAPKGLCPECLLRGGLESVETSDASRSLDDSDERTIHIVVPLDEPARGVSETLRYFGDYELLEELAVGGMGVVFKARQVSLNRLVAVKMIRAGQLAREGDIRRFRTEAEAAANLKHPSIVAIHEVGEHQGRHFFSMDFIEGNSLAELVRDRPLEPARASRLMQSVAAAIAYAHGRDVLHRDLKPANVMIDAQDQPHVTDFGLAKLLKSDSELTHSGAVLGSPSYMSPEQARGQGDQVSVRSDVYALGAMLYELLTARPPFLAATPLETMKLVAEREPVGPRTLNPSVPRDLETICLKCLQKEPEHRYASAEALAEDLGRWLRHEPIRARPSTVWEHGSKWALRHPARAGLVAVSAALPAVIIALLLFNEGRVASQRNRAMTNEVFALSEARRAETNALTARENLYAADLYVAAQFVESGQVGPALALLENHRPKSGEEDLRGFEWRYLRDQCAGTQTRILRGHKEPVMTLAFSPDGQVLASGDDRRVLLWDTTSWTNQGVLSGSSKTELNANATVSLAFSRDSQTLAAGGTDGWLKFWDVRARRSIGLLAERLTQIAFLPGTNLAFVGVGFDVLKAASGETRLYDWTTGKILRTLSNAGGLLALSADGRTLATTGVFGPVRIWDTTTGRERMTFHPPEAQLELLALSPDGRLVATCMHDRRQFQVWDATNGRWLAGGDGHSAPLTALTFSSDNLEIATASSDASVRLWTSSSARQTACLGGHLQEVNALAYSPDGRALAAAGQEGVVRVWDLDAVKHEWPISEILPPLVFSEDSRYLTALDVRGRPVLWEVESPALTRFCERTNLMPLFFSPFGDTLTFITRPDPAARWQLEVWDTATRTLRSTVTLAESETASAHFSVSRDGRRLAGSVSHPGEVLLWETVSGRLERRFLPTRKDVGEVVLSPSGQVLAVVPQGETISFWSADAGAHLASFQFYCPITTCRAFTPDGSTFVIGGTDSLIRLADTGTGALRATLAGHGYALSDISISPDGRTLASLARGTIKLWNLPTGREVATLLRGHPVRGLAFSADGRALCAPAWGPKPFVWLAPLDSINPSAIPRPAKQGTRKSQ